MPRRLICAGLAAVLAVVLGGCNEDRRVRTASPASGKADVTVDLKDLAFVPVATKVGLGQTVVWRWVEGTILHDVAFDDGPTSLKQTSGTWERTFPDPGSYDYVCTLHPQMTGTVTVG